MSKKCVFCIASSEFQATSIVDSLEAAGFDNKDISALLPDKADPQDFAHMKFTKATEIAATGVGAGALLGGALGWLTGIGALAIPGVGPLVAVGPIAVILSGMAVGSAMGGVTGALIGMGIPEHEAMSYEGKIKGGGILISVHTEDADEADLVQEIFRQEEAKDITSTSESTAMEREGNS